ncbi:hypothetical protein [Clostridium perfringens]|uniref:hypothetical protein n=1 Tax=Clostridium perfringens TaxID=1502 RepID=UPI000D712346|nr:hypothetical protein [Clostridium perfringens]PWW92626.1 hypothetical protein CYK76_00035 [Clostridium perfringens]PWX73096.1 hypothetical protein CYK77_04235 [Clostridium perfringens]
MENFRDCLNIVIHFTILGYVFYIGLKLMQGKENKYSLIEKIKRIIIDLLRLVLTVIISTLVFVGLLEIEKSNNIFALNLLNLIGILMLAIIILNKLWIDNNWINRVRNSVHNLYNKISKK